jgi:hypothetical protein
VRFTPLSEYSIADADSAVYVVNYYTADLQELEKMAEL